MCEYDFDGIENTHLELLYSAPSSDHLPSHKNFKVYLLKCHRAPLLQGSLSIDSAKMMSK